jgi:Glycosyl transferase family 90
MKTVVSFLPNRLKLALLRQHLAWSLGSTERPRPTFDILDRPGSRPLQVSLHKGASGIEAGVNLSAAVHRPFVYRLLYARFPAVLRVFSKAGPNVRMVTADLTDGFDPFAGGLAFCASHDDVILVPDPVFVNSGGYAAFRAPSLMLPWSLRGATVLWRGTSTGIGQVSTEAMAADDPHLRQRIRMCLMLRSVQGTDARIAKTESDVASLDRQRLRRHGLLGGKIAQRNWGRYKFAIDVDGHTNAWSNLFVRMLLGCCVLKIESQHGFRQWYYNKLMPWRHYVPVRADMADLVERIEWCRSHDGECAEIARAGSALAHAMSVDGEIAEAAIRLEAASKRSDGVQPDAVTTPGS